MSSKEYASQQPASRYPGFGWGAAAAYVTDALQRGVLYADVMRQRGNQYQAHLAEAVPNVLDFAAEIIMDGRELPRPVNYGLVRIAAPEDVPTVPGKRPFVVVDPRAGHGPGIGGFKRDSEIGAALRTGHPCYFIGFLPDPVPGQTVEDVMLAEAAFLEKVIALHPGSIGKPAVIGNCQAGWQVMMTAAMRPELFGPIILAGAPLSYWAGWRGRNPMRYSGGLLGGSWLTALTGDLGNGRFDGAWLVQNFENLNPANTLWGKSYQLYANVDTEAPRYLGFEKYWGGHVFLNAVEMQYIVDNLFVGNKLATAELITSDGTRLDLRHIRSPIVVFCSYGDNITPPPQALGWITDLYRDDGDVLGHDQTIVYATHDSIGHLGIFVSGSTGRKEHREFVSNIDLIDVLPAGLYQAQINDKTADTPGGGLVDGPYMLSIAVRGIEDVRKIVQPDAESDWRFATAARVSEVNLGLYRSVLQPLVRACVTPQSAWWTQALQPLRVSYQLWSDRSPLASGIAQMAEQVREQREPVPEDNPLLLMQNVWSDAIVAALDQWRDVRDDACEKTFEAIYGNPWVQALAGLNHADGAAARQHPGTTPEHRAFVAAEMEKLRGEIGKGGLLEAGVRAMLYILHSQGEADERRFNLARSLHAAHDAQHGKARPGLHNAEGLAAFKQMVRRQASLLRLAPEAAIDAVPAMLAGAPAASIREMTHTIETISTAVPLEADEQRDLARLLGMFRAAADAGAPRALAGPAPAPAKRRVARRPAPVVAGTKGRRT
ncbi:DUF3141 domain-containing protein [Cupriavidus basilensis]|uniref:DUF3141 domain-containing protein n=2 Tax=Cupriavidus TaxID=106589 RepID=UPI0007C6B22A|nr:DUF3141 domain-containing protein [Cupriavidus basilensis]